MVEDVTAGDGVLNGPYTGMSGTGPRVVDQARDARDAQRRMQALLRAHRSIIADLDLSSVLERIVEAACELVGVPYGALGVVDQDGTGLQEFIHVGMEPELVHRIGHLPEGRGLLGALVSDPRPIRLGVIGDDPRSGGFPAGHPELKGFLGVPIRVRDEVFGTLYLASEDVRTFTAEDEEVLSALAATAGVAIDNARLHEESVKRQEWLEATTDTTHRVLVQSGEEALRTIGRRVAGLSAADVVAVAVPDGDDAVRVVAAVGLEADRLVGFRYSLAGSLSERVFRMAQSQVVVDASTLQGGQVKVSEVVDLGPAMVLPLVGSEDVKGVLVVGRRRGAPPFAAGEVALATNFAHHASVALELAEARQEAQRVLLLAERARIARDLHDHVIQHLFATGMSLQSVLQQSHDATVRTSLGEAVEQLDDAIRQIRTYIFQLRDLSGPRAGLRSRVLAVCSDSASLLGYSPRTQFRGPVDTVSDTELADDVCAVVRESLSNVARHAQALSVAVVIAAGRGRLTVMVEDDGRGFGSSGRRSGINNLADRARARAGVFTVGQAHTGSGTRVSWSVPLPSVETG